MAKPGVRLEKVEFSLFGAKGTWVADEAQIKAAWELYVELVTRVAVQPLAEEEGLLREALTSLYALFGETRRILKHYGPDVAKPREKGAFSFGFLAVHALNRGIRPVLAKWHPLLQAHESVRAANVSPVDHERAWPQAAMLRKELDKLRRSLTEYAKLLAQAAGVPPLH